MAGATSTAPSPRSRCLPEIVDAVGARAEVFVDSGFRRGSDVAKALALGAKAVLIGRPTLYGAAVAGQAGVEHVLGILHRELLYTMAMTGCPSITLVNSGRPRSPNARPASSSWWSTCRSAGGDDRVDGEERADRDEDDLRVLADLEPEDQQRHPGERRHRADRTERRREQDVAEPREPDDGAERRGRSPRRSRSR